MWRRRLKNAVGRRKIRIVHNIYNYIYLHVWDIKIKIVCSYI